MNVKKKIMAVMVGFLVVGGAGSAFAAEAATDTSARSKLAETRSKLVEKLKEHPGIALYKAREYQEELDVLNGLRTERLKWKADISGKHGQVRDLTIAADDNGDTAALQAAKKIQAQINALNKEDGELAKKLRTDLVDFRKADKAGNTALAHTELKEAADVLTHINADLKEKSSLLDSIIAALQ